MYKAKAIIASMLVFVATFIIRNFILGYYGYSGPGDFVGVLTLARNMLQGQVPYYGINFVPYPLPAGLIALPFTLLPDRLAGTLFFSLSAAILAGAVTWKTGQLWRLLMLFSLPFVIAMEHTQWSPLITAAWYIPVLAPLMVIIKPQIALPVFLNRWAGSGYAIAGILLIVSLVISPGWPIRWVGLLKDYEHVFPLLLPGGFLLLLCLLNLSDKRARLLLFMAILPVRATYDLVPLFIIPETPFQMLVLLAVTWFASVNVWFLVALLYILMAVDFQSVKMRAFLLQKRLREIASRSG